MRRSEREVSDRAAIDDIINSCLICRLGLSDDGEPYIVPFNFGYEDNTLFFHAAREGRKLDIIRKNSRVCFEFDTDVSIVTADGPIGWSAKYRCVMGVGTATLVDDPAEKRKAYDAIMQHYAGRTFEFPDPCVDLSIVIKVAIELISGKVATG